MDMRYVIGVILFVVVGFLLAIILPHGVDVEKRLGINKEQILSNSLSKRMWEANNQYDINKTASCAKKFGGIDALIRKVESQDDIGFEAEQCVKQIINGKPERTEYRPKFSQVKPQPTAPMLEQWQKVGKFQYNPTSSGWTVLNSNHIGNGTCSIRCDKSIIRIRNTEYTGSTPGFPCDDLHVGKLISTRSINPQDFSKRECSIEQLSHK